MIEQETKKKVIDSLVNRYSPQQKSRIQKGVEQVALFWAAEDGTPEDYNRFCIDSFVNDPETLKGAFHKLEENFETLYGLFNKMKLDLQIPLLTDTGDLSVQDRLFGELDPSAHLTEDLFHNKIAFFVLLNFPFFSLREKNQLGTDWTAWDWAVARAADFFISRVPARINQNIAKTLAEADTYISEYNIYLGNLLDSERGHPFPRELKLVSHWGLRDHLKILYADGDGGLKKQRLIYTVMQRIITQEIPRDVINQETCHWDPVENTVYKQGQSMDFDTEPNSRYQQFLNVFGALAELDRYYPSHSTHIKRKFEIERELEEKEVHELFTAYLSCSQAQKVADLIKKRLGRDLEPFDIWYSGFKSKNSISGDELNRMVTAKYPDLNAFQQSIPQILMQLGFNPDLAQFLAKKISVEPARGAGHAWGAEHHLFNAHLRTRVPAGKMDFQGFNTAMHELGHAVEQTLTLHKVEHYLIHGVPNTAFTEAMAFLFQERDMEILGIQKTDPNTRQLKVLDRFWATFEIMGVAMVDMRIWNWLYENPQAEPEQLKHAVITTAKEVWNSYYADLFGLRDQTVLAIYSHMIDAALYLPDYPLGHIIEFQLEKQLENRSFGQEIERICSLGRLSPQLWMHKAVGSPVSGQPLLDAVDQALEAM